MTRPILLLLCAATISACADRKSDTKQAESAKAANATVHIRHERDYALDPGSQPFRLVLDAAGLTWTR